MEQHELEFTGLRKYLFWILGFLSFVSAILFILIALNISVEGGGEDVLRELFIYDELGYFGKIYAYTSVSLGIVWGFLMWNYHKWTNDKHMPKKIESVQKYIFYVVWTTTIIMVMTFFTKDIISISTNLIVFLITLYILLPAYLSDNRYNKHE